MVNKKKEELEEELKKIEWKLSYLESENSKQQTIYDKKRVLLKNKLIRHDGLYKYYWNYKRKSWEESSKNLYFDFGGCIFEILNDSFLRKITKDEFIKEIMSFECQ
ncbi:MAG: hypothetical protein NTX22_12505 [Ignavibacteriales bacterium]|nr:hypothetical protein [Ignavibacteriales bacterium]